MIVAANPDERSLWGSRPQAPAPTLQDGTGPAWRIIPPPDATPEALR
jgi:hypothetical protein